MAPSPTLDQRIHGITDPAILLFMAFKSPRDPTQPLVGSAAVIAQLLPTAEGVRVRKIYGAEPCVPLHKAVLASARKAGLADGVYEVVAASAERESLLAGLAKAGVFDVDGGKEKEKEKGGLGGVFDTIVCVRVLCSVEDVEETCETLYALLKPGGKLLFVEHVVNPWQTPKGSRLARVMQTVYSLLGWSFFVGSCHLTRNTGQILVNTPKRYQERRNGSGPTAWREVQLDTHFGWSALPFTSGTLVK
ncbi:hypothetical protein DV735_g809, partial [Chaetothyriales sp. CBS 134920]